MGVLQEALEAPAEPVDHRVFEPEAVRRIGNEVRRLRPVFRDGGTLRSLVASDIKAEQAAWRSDRVVGREGPAPDRIGEDADVRQPGACEVDDRGGGTVVAMRIVPPRDE